MIHADVITLCDGPGCHEAHIIEHNDLHVGERPPAVEMPAGWNGVDTGRTLCPRCSAEPVPQPEPADVAPFCGT